MPQFIHVYLTKILQKGAHCIIQNKSLYHIQYQIGIMHYHSSTDHVNKATIDLRHSILKASNDSKFILCSKDKVRPNFYFD